jgi:hypothetical protein
MRWGFLKPLTKYGFIILAMIAGTVAFVSWWYVHRLKQAIWEGRPTPVEDIRPQLALLESKLGRLLLVDNDLYELDGGKLIFKNWLKEKTPQRLFYDSPAKKFIAQYERGFVRYTLNGAEEATLSQKNKPAFSDDLKWAVYAKEKDIWRADVDWKAFKLVNERKVTSIGQFSDLYLADNIVVGTEKTLLVHNMNKVLHVNLETGAVKPMQVSLDGIRKRKSPDSKGVVGLENGKFYFYEVDTDDAKYFPVGRGAINDYQWLGNGKCVAIAAMKTVIQYDREKRTLTEVVTLPFQCNRIGEPSPDGRFVFCTRGGGVLVDVVEKTATPVKAGAGVCWVSKDTFAFAREVPDSDLRGTWLQTVGEGERRVSPEPYLVTKKGAELMVVKSAGLVVFVTKQGISKMKPDGTEVAVLMKLPHPPSFVQDIEDWKAE